MQRGSDSNNQNTHECNTGSTKIELSMNNAINNAEVGNCSCMYCYLIVAFPRDGYTGSVFDSAYKRDGNGGAGVADSASEALTKEKSIKVKEVLLVKIKKPM